MRASQLLESELKETVKLRESVQLWLEFAEGIGFRGGFVILGGELIEALNLNVDELSRAPIEPTVFNDLRLWIGHDEQGGERRFLRIFRVQEQARLLAQLAGRDADPPWKDFAQVS